MSKPFTPNLRTPRQDFSAEEVNKLNSNGIRGNLAQELRDNAKPDLGIFPDAAADRNNRTRHERGRGLEIHRLDGGGGAG